MSPERLNLPMPSQLSPSPVVRSCMRSSRRSWLSGMLAVGLAGRVRAEEPEDAGVAEVAKRLREVGLGEPRVQRTRRFVGVGDASDRFIKLTLRDCEATAADYYGHYRAKGFAVDPPKGRLVVVALAEDRSFARYLGADPGSAIGGVYEKTTNRLVVFDYRPSGPQAPLRPGYANLLCLAHEVGHQLAFNTGLLDREGDAPLGVVEGLAMYGEVRKFEGPSPPGALNTIRLEDMARIRRAGTPWIATERLLLDDRILRGAAGGGALLLGYGQSWLLIHHLMKTSPDRLRDYLAAIRPRRDPSARLDDARAHFGDLQALDEELKRLTIRLLKAGR